MLARLACVGSLALVFAVPFVRAQVPLAELASSDSKQHGWILHNVGDLDGDGLDDLAAAFAGRFELGEASEIELHSLLPTGGKPIAKWSVAVKRSGVHYLPSDRCGEAFAVLRRGPGAFEVAVGAPGRMHDGSGGGAVETWTQLGRDVYRRAWASNSPGDDFGAALVGLPDLDGDGRKELAIGAPGGDRVELVSATNGARIGELRGAPRTRFGAALALLAGGDASWSGGCLAVGAPDESSEGALRGAVHVLALDDGRRLRTLTGVRDGERLGARVLADDLDRDLVREIVVASLGGDGACASVCVVDTRRWERVWTHEFSAPSAAEGLRVDVSGDLNDDGWRDVLVTFTPRDRSDWPEALVLSGRDGSLVHAFRSLDPDRAPTGRVFRSDLTGLRLGSLLGLCSAGDQDRDGVDDVWFAMRSGHGEPWMRGSISLFSGARLSAPTTPQRSRARHFEVGARTPSRTPNADEQVATLSIADVPKLFTSTMGDGLSDGDRGWTCADSGFGRVVRALGDLDGDGLDEVWASGIAVAWEGAYSYRLASRSGERVARFKDGDISSALRIHDVDCDGSDDFAIGAQERTGRSCEIVGEVLLVSSRTNEVLHQIKHPGGAYAFASSLALVGDVDGDGVRDLAVGTPATDGWGHPDPQQAPRTCEVSIVALGAKSGVGTILTTLRGASTAADRFGETLVYGGDWDGDGAADLLVGAPRDSSREKDAGAVHVYSGADLSWIASFASSVEGEGLGRELAWGPDLDGDGRGEWVASAPWSGVEQSGRVVVIGSKDGVLLRQFVGRQPRDAFGASFVVGDLDGDGALEVVVGAPGVWREGTPHAASVSIFDFATGRERACLAGEPFLPANFMEGVEWNSRMTPYSYSEPTLPRFGRSLALANDLDGDGGCDLVIGSPVYRGPDYAGAVYALPGRALMREVDRHAAARRGAPADLAEAPCAEIDAMETLWVREERNKDVEDQSLMGQAQSAFGRIVVNVGRQSGRSGDDLLLGCRLGLAFLDESMLLVSGADPGANYDARVIGLVNDELVYCATRLGELDAALPPRYAVGSSEFNGFTLGGNGRARIFSGGVSLLQAQRPKPEVSFGGERIGDSFGQSLADAGDLDGDGVRDLATGYPELGYGVRLASGASGKVLDKLAFAVRGFGSALAAGRDLDGDGVGEIVVGASGWAGVGKVAVFSGKTRESLIWLEAPPDARLFGQTLALVDDVDGDGVAELIIGDPWAGPDSRGFVRLYSGRTFDVLRTWRGEEVGASFGRSFCADHDLDGDGVRDFVIGAPGIDSKAPRGAVYIVSPATGKALLRIDGEPRNPAYPWIDHETRAPESFPTSHSFGWAVATGNFDGDGVADLAIGSPQAGPNDCVGKVYAISGHELRRLWR
jgi:hypothetical protein